MSTHKKKRGIILFLIIVLAVGFFIGRVRSNVQQPEPAAALFSRCQSVYNYTIAQSSLDKAMGGY